MEKDMMKLGREYAGLGLDKGTVSEILAHFIELQKRSYYMNTDVIRALRSAFVKHEKEIQHKVDENNVTFGRKVCRPVDKINVTAYIKEKGGVLVPYCLVPAVSEVGRNFLVRYDCYTEAVLEDNEIINKLAVGEGVKSAVNYYLRDYNFERCNEVALKTEHARKYYSWAYNTKLEHIEIAHIVYTGVVDLHGERLVHQLSKAERDKGLQLTSVKGKQVVTKATREVNTHKVLFNLDFTIPTNVSGYTELKNETVEDVNKTITTLLGQSVETKTFNPYTNHVFGSVKLLPLEVYVVSDVFSELKEPQMKTRYRSALLTPKALKGDLADVLGTFSAYYIGTQATIHKYVHIFKNGIPDKGRYTDPAAIKGPTKGKRKQIPFDIGIGGVRNVLTYGVASRVFNHSLRDMSVMSLDEWFSYSRLGDEATKIEAHHISRKVSSCYEDSVLNVILLPIEYHNPYIHNGAPLEELQGLTEDEKALLVTLKKVFNAGGN